MGVGDVTLLAVRGGREMEDFFFWLVTDSLLLSLKLLDESRIQEVILYELLTGKSVKLINS